MEYSDALFHVAVGNEFGMFASHKKYISKALFCERLGFGHYFFRLERDAQNWVVPREATVGAVVDAFVGKIKRSEETNGPAETLLS